MDTNPSVFVVSTMMHLNILQYLNATCVHASNTKQTRAIPLNTTEEVTQAVRSALNGSFNMVYRQKG